MLAEVYNKDTLSRGVVDVVSRGRRAGHPYCVGELREQLQAEVFQPLVLFSSIDEHLVLRDPTNHNQALCDT